MRVRISRPVRLMVGGLAVLAAAATAAFATIPAHASTGSRHYDVEIGQACGWQAFGSGRFIPADQVTITVIDWEDPVDYVDFDVNFVYRVQSSPIAPPSSTSNPVGKVHMSHGAFVQDLTFKVVLPSASQYLRIDDWSPGSSEYHIRQMPNCGLPS
jgi:hypothetical protein